MYDQEIVYKPYSNTCDVQKHNETCFEAKCDLHLVKIEF